MSIDINELNKELEVIKVKSQSANPKERIEAENAIKDLLPRFNKFLEEQQPIMDELAKCEDPLTRSMAQFFDASMKAVQKEMEKLLKRDKIIIGPSERPPVDPAILEAERSRAAWAVIIKESEQLRLQAQSSDSKVREEALRAEQELIKKSMELFEQQRTSVSVNRLLTSSDPRKKEMGAFMTTVFDDAIALGNTAIRQPGFANALADAFNPNTPKKAGL